MSRAAAVALGLALAVPPAAADIVLLGEQHIGDNESATFTPSDPVTLDEFSGSATRFYLTEAITVSAITLDGLVQASPAPPVGFEFEVELDGVTRRGAYAGGTLTLDTPRSLSAGLHLIAIDPGCLNSGVQKFGSSCRFSDEYDMSFSSITLVTSDPTSITLARNLNRRRHLGDSTDSSNDNFGGRWYPDAPEATTLDVAFTLDRNLRLNEVRFYRLRDTASSGQSLSRATVSIVNTGTGVVTSIGTLSGDGNPRTLSASQLLLAGNYVVRVIAGQMKSPTSDSDKIKDDIRWNDILLLFGVDPTSTVGRFNSVDPDQDGVSGIVRTKTAGSPLEVDITAISNGSVLLTHTGDVSVKLLDASSDSGTLDSYGCRSSWVVKEDLGSVTFALTDLGRKRLSEQVVEAYPKARLLMTDTTLNVSGCSTDLFAVKPATFSLSVTHGTWETFGTTTVLDNVSASAATPIHKAGQPFTIRATAQNADGAVTTLYASSPTVLAVSSVLGATLGEARADLWTTTNGVAHTDVARYNEVGAFQLEVSDTTFASADAADTAAADRTIGPVTVNVGRFVPDHFEVTLNTPEFGPACNGSAFTYAGQAFFYSTEPVATLTAVAYAVPPTTTTNYTGDLYKLGTSPSSQTTYVAASPGTLIQTGLSTPDATIAVGAASGTATVTLHTGLNGLVFQRSTPAVPFDAEIKASLGTIKDDDEVTTSSLVVFGGTDPNTGIAFTGAANDVRFGRLVVDNAHGSELLPLAVPLRTEYWENIAGNEGFVTSLADNCTTVAPGDLVLTPAAGLPTAINNVQSPFSAGRGAVTLNAPGSSGYATLGANLSLTLLPHLRGDWDNDGNWAEDDNDPNARASFGVHRADDRRIYQREMVGN